jgi:hypothetical protein
MDPKECSEVGHWRDHMSRVLGIVALATFAAQVLGEDDFPIVGTYTENTPCAGDGVRCVTGDDNRSRHRLGVWSLHYPE